MVYGGTISTFDNRPIPYEDLYLFLHTLINLCRCSSWIGQTGNPQNINLAGGCWTPGIVAHEIGGYKVQRFKRLNNYIGLMVFFKSYVFFVVGHALGLYHEQSRPDRDDYVVIYRQNVIPSKTVMPNCSICISLNFHRTKFLLFIK